MESRLEKSNIQYNLCMVKLERVRCRKTTPFISFERILLRGSLVGTCRFPVKLDCRYEFNLDSSKFHLNLIFIHNQVAYKARYFRASILTGTQGEILPDPDVDISLWVCSLLHQSNIRVNTSARASPANTPLETPFTFYTHQQTFSNPRSFLGVAKLSDKSSSNIIRTQYYDCSLRSCFFFTAK